MKHVGEILERMQAAFDQSKALRKAELTDQAGGSSARALSALLTKRFDCLAGLVPTETTVAEFARVTVADDVSDAEARLGQCRVCPEYGGACDKADATTAPGLQPFWDGGIGWRPCTRFAEHTLRQKLAGFGVPLAMLGKRFRDYRASDPDTALAKKLATVYAKTFTTLQAGEKRNGVLLVGAPGAGKTHLAIATLAALTALGKIKTAAFRFVPKFLADLRDAFDEPVEVRRRFMADACTVDMLVLDDLGAERTTDWVREQLGIITNERWANRRPTIVTSNQNLEEFERTLGARAISRLEAMLLTIPIVTTDKRIT
jgi:hypothetical protein